MLQINLNINVVPITFVGRLSEAVEYVKKEFPSQIAETENHIAEGLVLKPQIDLFNRKGERIITKIKVKDFKK